MTKLSELTHFLILSSELKKEVEGKLLLRFIQN